MELFEGGNERPPEEVLELGRFGVYLKKATNPPKSCVSIMGMTLMGGAQFIVGALVTVCSAGAASSLGVQLLVKGAKDLYHSVQANSWQGKYRLGKLLAINKGISFAVSAVAMGWENFKAGLTAIKDQGR